MQYFRMQLLEQHISVLEIPELFRPFLKKEIDEFLMPTVDYAPFETEVDFTQNQEAINSWLDCT